jgi:hypothetical protein
MSALVTRIIDVKDQWEEDVKDWTTWPDVSSDIKRYKDTTKILQFRFEPSTFAEFPHLQVKQDITKLSQAQIDFINSPNNYGGVWNNLFFGAADREKIRDACEEAFVCDSSIDDILKVFSKIPPPNGAKQCCGCFLYMASLYVLPLWLCNLPCHGLQMFMNRFEFVDYAVRVMKAFNEKSHLVKLCYQLGPYGGVRIIVNEAIVPNVKYWHNMIFSIVVLQPSPDAPMRVKKKPQTDIVTWTSSEVSEWLAEKGFDELRSRIVSCKFDGKTIAELTDEEIQKEFPSVSFGERKRFFVLMKELIRSSSHAHGTSSCGSSVEAPATYHSIGHEDRGGFDAGVKKGVQEEAGKQVGEAAVAVAAGVLCVVS